MRIVQLAVCCALALTLLFAAGCNGGDEPREGGPCDIANDTACRGEVYLVCTAGTWKQDTRCVCTDSNKAVCS
ncbi:MAG: hypothetical protein KC503_41640 [Myxococcales bacterium]|nr:hypothetical protein [Myxococcales bacterium]